MTEHGTVQRTGIISDISEDDQSRSENQESALWILELVAYCGVLALRVRLVFKNDDLSHGLTPVTLGLLARAIINTSEFWEN